MRKLILLAGLILVISIVSNAQYSIKPTSVWRVNFKVMDYDTNYRDGDEIFKFHINSDTFINSTKYFKLYKSGIGYYDTPLYFENVYFGALRQENNRIYYIEKNKTTEVVLYDFDVKVGDTIKSTVEKDMVVTAIDTLDDGRRKISFWKTDFQHGKCLNWNNTFFIEGIGSMGGLFYMSPCDHVGFKEHYLICYYEDGQIVYKNTQVADTECNINIPNTIRKPKSNKIRVYPVPAKDKISVEVLGNYYSIQSIELFNLLGEKVLEKSSKSLTNKYNLNVESLRKGIYLLKINENHSFSLHKIIIE